MKHIKILYIIILCLVQLIYSCKKSDFLSPKPNSTIIIPESLQELRSLLDNVEIFTVSTFLGEMSSDCHYITYTNWQALTQVVERNTYSWEKDIYGGTVKIKDWTIPYQQVMYCNVVLSQLSQLTVSGTEENEKKDIEGSAYFLRALAYYNLVQHFSPAFDSATAENDLGLPIRLSPDINQISARSSVKKTYDQILLDLTNSCRLLNSMVPVTYKNRPSKPAAYALLSRIYLSMRVYENAKKYADSCLNLYRQLIDFNTLSPTATTPIDRGNVETMYTGTFYNYSSNFTATSTSVYIDTTLYNSYSSNDLRKVILFRVISGNNIGVKRSYNGSTIPFSGLAIDEVYLNRAECLARAGNTNAALNDLDTLLIKRWKTGTFVPVTASSPTDALNKVLIERKKELVWRGLRWIDLRRFNKEGTGIALKRILNSQTYILPPNSPLYVLPIPDDEVALSGIAQNPR